MKCKVCKGEGWVVGYGHACDGDERACEVLCPIQVQEPCEACLGTGRRLTKRALDFAPESRVNCTFCGGLLPKHNLPCEME